jgi:predicted acetyltransferase
MTAANAPGGVLQRASAADAPLLENLLELYIHDLSEIVAVEPGPDGRFGYPRLAQYFTEPERRHAFLIRSGVALAGFALVTRGSPASDDPEALDVAEFFVLRRHRRTGIGREAAFALWDLLPGQWVVRVFEANRSGLPFWSRTVREYAGGAFSERSQSEPLGQRRVFHFASRGR